VNPAAVEHMTHVKGGWGRIVWMPTFDSENQVRFDKANRPFASVSKDGRLLPEVNQVLALIAKHKLTMATGHSSAQEGLMLIRAAKDLGVTSMVVTHAMEPPIRMTIPQMKQAAAMGAYIEFVYNALIGPKKVLTMSDYVPAIRAIGPEHCILSSDLGQAGNPLHPDGLEAFFRGLRDRGFTVAEIDRMAKVNPARLLGLE
jgi:predicted TIM-barrel fold metal-dependent hydrolase